jgi:catechol 2,3-dioxygenase-like lactoylglutathione lyase family enzyme
VIHALDCVTLAAASPAAAVHDYATLLEAEAGTGVGGAVLHLANVRLDFVQAGAHDAGGLAGLTFAVADLAKAENLLARRGLRVHRDEALQQAGGRRLYIATDSTHGVPMSLMERAPSPPAAVPPAATTLDHVVVRSANPERAVALYGGRLGLSLRLDRSEPSWGARLLFFRCGDLVIEIAHDLKAGVSDEPDRLWGLSWRVPDLPAAHVRLKAAGLAVSDVRRGRRPGTRVFTVRDHTAGVPTLVLGSDDSR